MKRKQMKKKRKGERIKDCWRCMVSFVRKLRKRLGGGQVRREIKDKRNETNDGKKQWSWRERENTHTDTNYKIRFTWRCLLNCNSLKKKKHWQQKRWFYVEKRCFSATVMWWLTRHTCCCVEQLSDHICVSLRPAFFLLKNQYKTQFLKVKTNVSSFVAQPRESSRRSNSTGTASSKLSLIRLQRHRWHYYTCTLHKLLLSLLKK